MIRSLLATLIAMTAACSRPPPPDPAFVADWNLWHADREARLRRPDGWLALVGLHWLTEGENRIEGLPGRFLLSSGRVTLAATAADGWTLDGQPVTGSRPLASDESDEPDRIQSGSRSVIVIERGRQVALRVWDAKSPLIAGFRGVGSFPADPRWRIVGRWEPYPEPRTVEVPALAGDAQIEEAPGRVHFEVDGRPLTLEPTSSHGGLFFIFRDATSKDETYGAGRYLSAAPPVNGRVVLDFNRAVNPPCAFTPYATCPIARPENVLPVRIEAGEKRYGEH